MAGAEPPRGTGPYRPPAGLPVVWPDAFGTRFLVTVDTEEEFDWSAPLNRESRGTTAAAAIPAAHARFVAARAALVYLVDHPIATDAAAVAAIRETFADGRSTVGTQLHPWVNPPFEEAMTPANSFAGNLPKVLEAAKLAELTTAIEVAFGRRPVMYRAGRYGVGPASWQLLAAQGYRIDSSLRARHDYSAGGGPDFSRVGNDAFVTPEGLIELPLTTVFTGLIRSPALYRLFAAVPHGVGVSARSGLVQRVALTPEQMPLPDALAAIRVAHGEGVRLLNFAFHSPTLVPGHTPYVRDAAELAVFWRWWDGVFDLLAKLGIASASLDEILAAVPAPAVGPAGLEPAT